MVFKNHGNDGLFNIVEKLNNNRAEAKTVIGYAKNPDEIYYFEGSIKGTIVKPNKKSNFGWDPIFQPDGFSKSFAEFTIEEKNKISMRKIAFTRLKEFIDMPIKHD